MSQVSVKPGLLVRDQYARKGIVYERRERPPEKWIRDQRNVADIRKLPHDVTWWAVMPLTGGLVLIPEPMLEVLRETTFEDFLAAADGANVAARKQLALMFPSYVDRILAERRGWDKH